MLAYILAIAIGSSSLVLFMTAFVQPEIHRKDDFFWSGMGLFYALVLWFCANRLTGGVLLGQVAAVALILSYNWQNLQLRKAIAHPEKQIALESFSITQVIQNFFGGLISRFRKPKTKVGVETATTTPSEAVLETEEPSLEAETQETERDREEIIEAQIESPITETSESSSPALSETEVTDTSTIEPEQADLSQKPESQKRSFSLKNLFSFGKKKSSPVTTTKSELSNLDEILDAELEESTTETDKTENLDATSEPKGETAEFEAIEEETTSDTDSEIKAAQTSQIGEIIDNKDKVETETSDLIETTEDKTKSEPETANSDFSNEDKETSSFPSEAESEATPPEPPTPEMKREAQQDIETQEEKEAINVEEIAPEVELAPPAESLGEGDPTMRKNLEESSDRSQQEEQKE
ncbi:hypothetical protein IQ238_26760 [Pleurocapsales cyanobacterium LEGE 06147]|nr:hypothetical protein [Pleurocapsales cyanobacterium LEGE 06147]